MGARTGSEHYVTVLGLEGINLQDDAGIREAADRVRSANPPPVVAVPAMGRTADRIQRAVEKSCQQDVVWALTLAEGLRTYHMQVAEMVTAGATWKETKSLLSDLFEEFAQFLQGLYLLGELTDHGRRVAAFYGEKASSVIQAGALGEKGIAVRSLGGRETLLSCFGPEAEKARKEFQGELEQCLKQGTVPLIPSSLREGLEAH